MQRKIGSGSVSILHQIIYARECVRKLSGNDGALSLWYNEQDETLLSYTGSTFRQPQPDVFEISHWAWNEPHLTRLDVTNDTVN